MSSSRVNPLSLVISRFPFSGQRTTRSRQLANKIDGATANSRLGCVQGRLQRLFPNGLCKWRDLNPRNFADQYWNPILQHRIPI